MTERIFEQAKKLFFEGLRAFETEDYGAAEALFAKSLELMPGRVSTMVNLAATRARLGYWQQVLDLAESVRVLEPNNSDILIHRASALAGLDRNGEALADYDKLLADGPGSEFLWLLRGEALQRLGRPQEALSSYDQALRLNPGLAQAWSHRGGILREMNRLDEAAESFRRALDHKGDRLLHEYYLASVSSEPTPAAAPLQYVETLFDQYAGEFDQHLVQTLNYRAHELLTRHLRDISARDFEAALDLGCGTGLCGRLVRPWVKRMVGVDLSTQMLAQARSLEIYDHLEHAELASFLRQTDQRFDLAMAGDVFIYLGDLAPIFEGIARVIEREGIFCFSAELAPGGGPEVRLLPTLRFAHSEAYLRKMAERFEFRILKFIPGTIREEQRRPISGIYGYLAKT